MAEITNKAILNYNSGTTLLSTESNTAKVTLQGPMVISKRSLETDYQMDTELTYSFTVTNTSTTALTGLVIIDDLGTYDFSPTVKVTPLTYIGPAQQFTNGTFTAVIAGTVAADNHSVSFNVGALDGLSNVTVLYKVKTNEFAMPVVGTSTITNTVTATATGIATPVTASHSVPVASYADVTIQKEMTPDPIVDGSTLSYIFNLSNTGTIPATYVILEDLFNPAPALTSVTLNGSTIDPADYDYSNGYFIFPAAASSYDFQVPAATSSVEPTTGAITRTPGTSTLIIQGTI